ncbi:MAG: ISAs1 family transposase [Thermomicrobiales bacterium]
MQSMTLGVPEAIVPGLVPATLDLVAAFAGIPDPRRPHGRRFPLVAILALALTALLANHLSVLAIAQWGKRQSPAVLAALGFPDSVTPHQTTLQRLFRTLDPRPLAVALTDCFAPAPPADTPARGSEGVAFDGKAQRGRLACADQPEYPVHMLSAVLHDCGIVLAQTPLDHTGEKAEAELTAAPTLVARLDWAERVMTGDALDCDRGRPLGSICTTIIDAEGDYLVIVKENQATLLRAIATLFASRADAALAAARLPIWDMREATTVDKGHGRLEVRHLVASTALNDYLDWPGVAQVMVIERTWWERGEKKQAIRYGITSLPATSADAPRLLALVRGHWQIENGLHDVKDVTLGEDRSLIHKGNGPSIMAILRDTVVSVLHRAGWRTIAERLRYYGGHPQEIFALLGIPLAENA